MSSLLFRLTMTHLICDKGNIFIVPKQQLILLFLLLVYLHTKYCIYRVLFFFLLLVYYCKRKGLNIVCVYVYIKGQVKVVKISFVLYYQLLS